MSKRPFFDYRVVKKTYNLPHGQAEPYYTICQVWYDLEEDKIETFSEEGVTPTGDCLEFLEDEINLMRKALSKPILEEIENNCVVELREINEV